MRVSVGAQCDHRIRDPLLAQRHGKRQPPPSAGSRRVEQKKRRAWRVESTLDAAIAALKQVSGQEALGAAARPSEGPDRARLRGHCQRYIKECGGVRWGACGRDEAALGRLLREPSGAYGNAGRGTVVPCRVDQVALPESTNKFDIPAMIPEFENWVGEMLVSPEDWDARVERAAEIPSHHDPALRTNSRALLALAVRLFRAGLVTPVKKKGPYGVRMFTVAKSESSQRLIFDMRRVNALFRKPADCRLGSGAALASLNLSAEEIGHNECAAAAGDLPNFFYTLSLGQEFAELVWLDGLPLGSFLRELVREGLATEAEARAWAASCDGVGFRCLPMGWSWAPAIAQRVLEWLLERAGESEEGRLRHGSAAAAVTPEQGANMAYIDDFSLVAVDTDARAATQQAEQRLSRVRHVLSEAGLGCHKCAMPGGSKPGAIWKTAT